MEIRRITFRGGPACHCRVCNTIQWGCLGSPGVANPPVVLFLEAEGSWVILGCLGSAWVLNPWKGIADQSSKGKAKTPYDICPSRRNPFNKKKHHVRKTEKKHQINATFGRKNFALPGGEKNLLL